MSAADMMMHLGVGPVLQATPFAAVVIAAIDAENEGVVVRDEGGYLRVQVPRVCRLSRSTLVATAGHEVRLPGDLEVIMSSFTGLVRMSESEAVWWLATEPVPAPLAPDAEQS